MTAKPDETASPATAPWRRWTGYAFDAGRHFFLDQGQVMAGHLSFVGLLSLFPFLIFLAALAGFLGQTEAGTHFVAFLLETMPPEVAGVLETPMLEVLQETRGELLTIGILASVWTSSSGVEAARLALNRAYETDNKRAVWRTRIESMALVLVASGFVIFAMLILIVGPVIWAQVRNLMVVLPDGWQVSWTLVRYGISAILILTAISALYHVLPTARLRLRWVLPGALVVVVLWGATATASSVFLRHVNSYSVTYGSLGGIVVALLFFYVLALIFIYGAEFNAAIARADGGLPERRLRGRHGVGL